MKKALEKGSYVEIIDPNLSYQDLFDEFGKELGGDLSKWHPKPIQMKQQGTVLNTHKEGYVLFESEGGHYLIDTDAVKPALKPADMKFLVRFIRRGVWEEFDSEASIKARIIELVKSNSLNFGDEIKVYEISNVKPLKFDLSVFLG